MWNTCSKEILLLQMVATDLFIPSLASALCCWIWLNIHKRMKFISFIIHIEKLINFFQHNFLKRHNKLIRFYFYKCLVKHTLNLAMFT